MNKKLLAMLLGITTFTVVEEGKGGDMVAIEDLMDASLDDLKDLPGFEVPPKGHYQLIVSLEKKVVNDHNSIEAKCEVVSTLELANKNETAVENGTKFGQLFMMDNEWGQGGFKGFAVPIGQAMGFATVGQCVAGIQNVKIAATLNHRYHKEDRSKPVAERRTYADLKNIEVL